MATWRRGRGEHVKLCPASRSGPNGFRLRATDLAGNRSGLDFDTDFDSNSNSDSDSIPIRIRYDSIRKRWHCYALRTRKPPSKCDVCAGLVPVPRLPIATQSQFRNLPAFSPLYVIAFAVRPSRGIKKGCFNMEMAEESPSFDWCMCVISPLVH